jgi:hypothetical protein
LVKRKVAKIVSQQYELSQGEQHPLFGRRVADGPNGELFAVERFDLEPDILNIAIAYWPITERDYSQRGERYHQNYGSQVSMHRHSERIPFALVERRPANIGGN